MTTTNHMIQQASAPQTVRDQNARQLRSDFLASLFNAACNRIREAYTYSPIITVNKNRIRYN